MRRAVLEFDQRAPVERADVHRRVGECLVHAFEPVGIDLITVDAEEDQLGLGRARLPQQIEPGAVAEIDLRTELRSDVDHLDVAVDQRDGHAARHQHLCNRLPEAAVTDDQRVGAVGLGPVAFAVRIDRRLAERARRHHQERRRRHRQCDHRAEQARRLGRDQQAGLCLPEQDEAELAALAEQQAEPECGPPRHAKRAPDEEDDRRLGDDQRRRHAGDEERSLGNRRQV